MLLTVVCFSHALATTNVSNPSAGTAAGLHGIRLLPGSSVLYGKNFIVAVTRHAFEVFRDNGGIWRAEPAHFWDGGKPQIKDGLLLSFPREATTSDEIREVPLDGSASSVIGYAAGEYSGQTQLGDISSGIVSTQGNALNIALPSGLVTLRGVTGKSFFVSGDQYKAANETVIARHIPDGGTLLLYRYTVDAAGPVERIYPTLTLPGRTFTTYEFTGSPPFRKDKTYDIRKNYDRPYAELALPLITTDANVAVLFLGESPGFEEPIEPFASAYDHISVSPAQRAINVFFDGPAGEPSPVKFDWSKVATSASSGTFVSHIGGGVRSLIVTLPEDAKLIRCWYRTADGNWHQATTQRRQPYGRRLWMRIQNANQILVEIDKPAPDAEGTSWTVTVPFVLESRWAAFAVYGARSNATVLRQQLAPALKALNDTMYSLRDRRSQRRFALSWNAALRRTAFTTGKNFLNPKFWDHGLPVAGDPLIKFGDYMSNSVSWVTADAALQALEGSQMLGLPSDPRYGQGVASFDDRARAFYYGAYNRKTHAFADSDTSDKGFVIGYNYLLSLRDLTDVAGTPEGLSVADTRALVDRVLPTLHLGWIRAYPMEDFEWSSSDFTLSPRQDGMGRGLSETRLAYICGEWYAATKDPKYRSCERRALELATQYVGEIQSLDQLDGMDILQVADAIDALSLAYSQSGNPLYLDSLLGTYKELLLSAFSWRDYGETVFDDRGMTASSFQSTFFDRAQGNFWRADSWDNARAIWSLAKLLRFGYDRRIVWQMQMASESHKQSMPAVDALMRSPEVSDFYYQGAVDPNDYDLMWESLVARYSTKLDFSDAIWRDAWIFDSVTTSSGQVFRIPGVTDLAPGSVLVVGAPGTVAKLRIISHDAMFASGSRTATARIGSKGYKLVSLRGCKTCHSHLMQ
jgi:hypothetical protein